MELLTTDETLIALSDLISDAKETLTLVSPFIGLWGCGSDTVRDGLKQVIVGDLLDAMEENEITLTVLSRERGIKNWVRKFGFYIEAHLYQYEDFHCKCYFNESTLIISTLNLDSSTFKNEDIGILINRNEEPGLYEDYLERFYKPLIEQFEKVDVEDVRDEIDYFNQPGHCISCNKRISFDPKTLKKPFCSECYDDYVIQDYNWSTPQNFCYGCHKSSNRKHFTISRKDPFCPRCKEKYCDGLDG